MTAKKKDLEIQLIEDLLEDQSHVTALSGDLPPEQAKKETEATIRLNESKITSTFPTQSTVRTTVGRMAVKSSGGFQGAAEAHLIQSENLRVAQQRILDLETETERLRQENEKLAAAGETIRKRSEELEALSQNQNRKIEEIKDHNAQEKEIMHGSSQDKDRELNELRLKVQEFEIRLSANLQKIRVRERELENRLELVRLESSAVNRSKDDTLLDLKRQIDQLNIELENYRKKTQEFNKQIQSQQELVRRTVKALRLALSMLEGEAPSGTRGTGT